MAVLKVITGKNSTSKQLQGIIKYCKNPGKTENMEYTYAKDLLEGKEFQDMMNVKAQFKKDMPGNGRYYLHIVQSFSPTDPNATPETVHQIGKEMADTFPAWKNCQVLVSTHVDKGHIHNHFVINNVNMVDGKKWNNPREDTVALKELTNELSAKYNCEIMDFSKREKKERTWDSKEFQAQQDGRSWKQALQAAINQSSYAAASQKQFGECMNSLGYQVKWDPERKYITFTTPAGKLCRNNKLFPPENYTKEALDAKLEIAYDRETRRELRTAVYQAGKVSINQNQFCNNMERLGYKTEWDQTTKTINFTNNRKTFSNHGIETKIQDPTLGDNQYRPKVEDEKRYTMDRIQATLDLNKDHALTGLLEGFAGICRGMDMSRHNGEEHPLNSHMDMTEDEQLSRQKLMKEGMSIWQNH